MEELFSVGEENVNTMVIAFIEIIKLFSIVLTLCIVAFVTGFVFHRVWKGIKR